MSLKRWVGLDAVDLVIQFGVTFFLMVLADQATTNGRGSPSSGRRHLWCSGCAATLP